MIGRHGTTLPIGSNHEAGMQYLIVANLLFSAALIIAAVGAGLYFHFKRQRRRRVLLLRGNPSRDYSIHDLRRRPAGTLNYSSFVYLDVDRDGRYSLGDRPMGGIKVRLSGAAGHLLSSRTNVNGFANFSMSAKSRKASIRSPGTYRFEVSVPSGWTCTSKNDVQTMAFNTIEGSPAGLGAAEMVRPVGLAPICCAKGRTDKAVSAQISAIGSGAVLAAMILGPDSDFSFQVPEQTEELVIEGEGVSRRLRLSPYPTDLGLLSPKRACIDSPASLETIDFDGVTARGLRKIPSGYAKLNWFNLNVVARDFHSGSEGYVNGNTSGDHTCYTSSGHPAEIWSDEPFDFHSVMLSSAWLTAEGETAKIECWQGQTLIASDMVQVSALGPVHYAPMLKAVTRIRLSSKAYWQLVVDDLILAR